MVLKTLIAATCAAILAGGMVYFSTTPSDNGGTVALKPAISAQNEAPKTAQKSQKPDLLKRYLDKDEPAPEKASTVSEGQVTMSAQIGNAPIGGDLDAPIKDAEEISEPAQDNSIAADGRTSLQTVNKLKEKMRENPQVNPQAKPKPKLQAKSDDPAKDRIAVVFNQAELIAQPDLKDRAYLDLADYATGKGLFDDAKIAALKIGQKELRDTARSRIAIGMARYGYSDQAFEMIESVEIEELRDVMRLQVIEALLGTDGGR